MSSLTQFGTYGFLSTLIVAQLAGTKAEYSKPRATKRNCRKPAIRKSK